MEEYETVEETEVDSVDDNEVESEVEEEVVEVDADDGKVDWWGKDSAPSYW